MIEALADIYPEMKALSGHMAKARARRLPKAAFAKARGLIDAVLGPRKVRRLVAALDGLDDVAHLRRLLATRNAGP